MIYTNISWLPKNSSIDIVFKDNPSIPVTAVFCFVFSPDMEYIYLMENVNRSRGLDIPGGHIDPGETPIQALHREILEEIGLSIKNIDFVGSQIITKDIPEDKYPDLVSSQNFYTAIINSIETDSFEDDSLERVKMKVSDYIDYLNTKSDCYYKDLFFRAINLF